MAEANNNALEVSAWGSKIKATGPIVILLFITIACNFALVYLSMAQHKERAQEHQILIDWNRFLECQINLGIYIHTLPKGTEMTLTDVPRPYRRCFSGNFEDGRTERRDRRAKEEKNQ